jgi:hypothetical protein
MVVRAPGNLGKDVPLGTFRNVRDLPGVIAVGNTHAKKSNDSFGKQWSFILKACRTRASRSAPSSFAGEVDVHPAA